MPRADTIITIKESPELLIDSVYEVLVKLIKINRRKNLLKVTLQNLDAVQYGRSHMIILPLPACPGNPVCLFLEACGVNASEIGKEIDLTTLIGKRLGVQFLHNKSSYDHRSVKFTKLQEKSHENRAQ
jgi:hypothetical protein